jgi:hypothetical protein
MIKLLFEKNSQYFLITIDNKKIYYWDKLEGKIWGGPLQYLPPDPKVRMKIILSRNKIPANMVELLKILPEELKEFEDAKDDMELRDIVLRDTQRKGCKLVDMKIE